MSNLFTRGPNGTTNNTQGPLLIRVNKQLITRGSVFAPPPPCTEPVLVRVRIMVSFCLNVQVCFRIKQFSGYISEALKATQIRYSKTSGKGFLLQNELHN